MRTLFSTLIFVFGFATLTTAQTAHDIFMSSKIKTNTTNDPNSWVHGDNTFTTSNVNDWNMWNFAYMGLEGKVHTENNNDFTSWKVDGLDIILSNSNGNYMSWNISGQDKSVSLMTTNWNTWVVTGDLVSGISTTDTDDFSEWEINGGDWTSLSPQFRAATVFISVISSSVLQNL